MKFPTHLRGLSSSEWPSLASLIVLSGLSYTLTLLTGIHYFGDTTKAQFVGRLLGTTHPTGYPLYILLTSPFSWIPLGSLAQRINAFSALCGVLTLIGVYGIQRLLGVRKIPAVLASLALTWSRVFWGQTVIAEVYTLNSALMTATFYCLLRHAGRAENWRWFFLACASYSLSFGNHLTVVTFLPAFFWATFTGDSRALFQPRRVLAVLACIVTGAALYGYLFTRTPENTLYLEYHIRNFRDLWRYVTGHSYQGKMLAYSVPEILTERLPRFLAQLHQDFGPLIFLTPLGLVLSFLRSRRDAILLSLAALCSLLWVTTYDIPDIEVYMIPVEVILCLFLGVALDFLAFGLLHRALTWRTALRISAVTALTAWQLVTSIRSHAPDHTRSTRFERSIERQLDHLDRNAVLIGPIFYNPRMAFIYHLYAEGRAGTHNLYFAGRAEPHDVARYLRGEAPLVDSQTGKDIPFGLRVFSTPRANDKPWKKNGITQSKARQELRQLKLTPPRVPETARELAPSPPE